MTILVAHMSDLHFCQKNLAEADRTFGFAVDNAIMKEVRAAVITGDCTDHALEAHDSALRVLAKHLRRLADHCPVLMLQGTFSHEPPGLLRVLEMIGANNPITVADRIGMFGLNSNGFESFKADRLYEMTVTAFPTLNRADLVAARGIAGAPEGIGDLLFEVMRGFSTENMHQRAQGVPTMLIGHGTVHECETEHGVPMAGPDHEFGVGALFAAGCDVAALGHIHKHQEWRRERQVIAYAGSIGRFHHGEEGDKHYLVWRLEPGNPTYEAVVTPSRRTVDLFFDGVPDMQAIAAAAAECAGAYVRLRYSVDEESKQLVNREAIRSMLAGACDLQIEGKTLIIERQRAPGISTTVSLDGKLRAWCEVTQSDAAPLAERLSLLQVNSSAEIVENIMKGIRSEVSEIKSDSDYSGDHCGSDRSDRSAGVRYEGSLEYASDLKPAEDIPELGEHEWLQNEESLFS